ncbi:hypothetical protein B4091_4027 [Bacillus licheniformis]|nr:hypothetical protein B4091_4027 [Bacillus licheniformis]
MNEETRILTFRIILQCMQSLCLAAYIKTFVTARFLEWGRSVFVESALAVR